MAYDRYCNVAVLSVLVWLTTAMGIGQGQVDQSICVPTLPELKYPQSALEKRIMGVVTTELNIDEHGVVTQVESKGYPLLVAGAETAVRSGIFGGDCEGKRFAMQFNFRLDGDLDPSTPVVVRSQAPLVYEIVSPMDRIIVTTTCPPMYGTKTLERKFIGWLVKLRFW